MKKLSLFLGLAAVVAFAAAFMPAPTFDPDTGTGFVGKGDVQLAFGWNNKQFQDNAHLLTFDASSVSETTWTCSRENPHQQVQQRHNTTTTQGVASHTLRERNQITGIILDGYDGDATVTTEGHAPQSCPGGGGWTFDEGSEVTTVIGGGLFVTFGATTVQLL